MCVPLASAGAWTRFATCEDGVNRMAEAMKKTASETMLGRCHGRVQGGNFTDNEFNNRKAAFLITEKPAGGKGKSPEARDGAALGTSARRRAESRRSSI